ncbi:MAG: hypothetical protein ABW166_09915 [Sedimenticola sp.]
MIDSVKYLLSVQDVISIYGILLSSINTIWNIYVFVLLGMVGWILARAHEFLFVQKMLLSVVFIAFNVVVLFYFFDAYSDIDRVRVELTAFQEAAKLSTVKNGISENIVQFDPINRFINVFLFIGGFGLFVLFLIWSKSIWSIGRKEP